jgi:RNA polymerase sigma factor (sigma-70 family)
MTPRELLLRLWALWHSGSILRWARQHTPDLSHACEVCAELFVRVSRVSDAAAADIHNPDGYFVGTIVRLARSSRRRLGPDRRLQYMDLADLEELSARGQRNVPSVLRTALDREMLQKLDEVIPRLSPRRREVFDLRVKKGLSVPDIARTLGLSESTVFNHLNAATRAVLLALLQADLRPEDLGGPPDE